ncbi:hypothetical protein FRC04_012018 [Tulasnella sp. 424]|nr:hypothetical protein FRC04_012018 [Tulasnella sp. 424]KAG8971259.1 hypothetical protein FRC05_011358 [Tulasnella sp. 425]
MASDAGASTAPDKPISVKLVLLGEGNSGKSSIVQRFVSNEFQANKEPTIGAAFLTQRCRLEDRVFRYELWDTAGAKRFDRLAPMYYRNAQAAVLVYDVTKASSLEKAKSWVKEVQRQANPNIIIALAGNKVDLVTASSAAGSSGAATSNGDDDEDETDDATATLGKDAGEAGNPEGRRQVPKDEAQAYASEAGLVFFEISAKTGEGIVEMFTEIAKKIPIEHFLNSRGGANRAATDAVNNAPTTASRFNISLPTFGAPQAFIKVRQTLTSMLGTVAATKGDSAGGYAPGSGSSSFVAAGAPLTTTPADVSSSPLVSDPAAVPSTGNATLTGGGPSESGLSQARLPLESSSPFSRYPFLSPPAATPREQLSFGVSTPRSVDPQEITLRAVLEDLEHLVISPSRLTILDGFQVGSGGYGEVVLAKLDAAGLSAREVAVKQLRTVGTNGLRMRVALRLARELKIWAKVNHPNILSLIGYYLSENYEIAQLVSPFMVNGNILRHIAALQPDIMKRLGFVSSPVIKGHSGVYTAPSPCFKVRDITAGMDYLHRFNSPICHGDLKPANVLIADSGHAVLCDFGLASIADDAQISSGLTTSRSLKGSTRYMGPELISEQETKHTLASDVWAWACTVFQIFTDVDPYPQAKTEMGIMAAILQHKCPGDLTMLSTGPLGEHMKELGIPLADHIGGCWSFEPAERPSIADSLRLVCLGSS